MGNPILELSQDQLIVGTQGAETVRKVEKLSEERYVKFVKERLYISAQSEKTNRIDIVLDVYLSVSPNQTEKETVHQRKDFLQYNNKNELFAFLSDKAVHLSLADGKELLILTMWWYQLLIPSAWDGS